MTLNKKRKLFNFPVFEGTRLGNVYSIKYLGVKITSDLRWNVPINNVFYQGILRRNLEQYLRRVKAPAYNGLVRLG